MVEVTDAPLLPERAIELVRSKSHGGIISYVGTVRDSSNGRQVLRFGHDVYWNKIARRELERIVAEIHDRWGLEDVAVLHRTGMLEPGEVLLVVAVGAPHRDEAFEACRYAIDRYKEASSSWIVESTTDP